MKRIIPIILTLASLDVSAITVTPNVPGINVRDLTARSVIVDPDGQIYTSVPGMPNVKDISEPAYYFQGNEIIPEAVPGIRSRDFTEPSYSIDYDQ